jgi:hypothetical protein
MIQDVVVAPGKTSETMEGFCSAISITCLNMLTYFSVMYLIYGSLNIKKGKAVPVTGHGGP